MSGRLSGKVALITGASRGIGLCVAKAFAQEGARVFLVGHTDQRALDHAVRSVKDTGAEADGGLFDVGDHTQVTRLADRIADRFGALDIVVNNAGIIRPAPLLEITPTQWDQMMHAHLYSTFYCTVEMTRRFLRDKGAGKIINVTAPAALRGSSGVADYAAAKGGISAFTKNAAKELAPFNIQVNAVLPVAQSRMIDALVEYDRSHDGTRAAALAAIPTPEVLNETFLFFASAASDYVTGQILAADGGATN